MTVSSDGDGAVISYDTKCRYLTVCSPSNDGDGHLMIRALDYLGQITFKEQTNISAETFSFIAKLALISSDGTEFMALSMLFSH